MEHFIQLNWYHITLPMDSLIANYYELRTYVGQRTKLFDQVKHFNKTKTSYKKSS